MKNRRDFTLTEEQLITVKQQMKNGKRPETRQRAQAIHLLSLGHSVKAVAEMMAVERRTIYNWHDAWLARGEKGLVPGRNGGRRPKATPEYCQRLAEIIETEPSDHGFSFAIWTVDRLRSYLAKETNIELSARAFGDLLKREGYVYRRPKHSLKHLQDATVIAQAEQHLDDLKKRPRPKPSNSSLWMKPPLP